MLIVLSGLPGSGKSAVAQALGRRLPAPVVSVDPIEAAMWRAGISRTEPTGLAAYLVAETVADEILALGQPVIVDAVNGVEPARNQWRSLAQRWAVPLRVLETVCPDPQLHRARLEARTRDIAGFPEPTWESVERSREEYEPWTEPHLVLDSTTDLAANLAKTLDYVT
jgi:predicted kinase